MDFLWNWERNKMVNKCDFLSFHFIVWWSWEAFGSHMQPLSESMETLLGEDDMDVVRAVPVNGE